MTGLEDKPLFKTENIDIDTSNLSGSSGHGFQNFPEGFSVNLEHLELNPITNLSSLLFELLQSDDASSGDSSFVRSTAMNKLLLLKQNILKVLDKTECEIESFENELKSLVSEPHCPTASNSLRVDCESKSCEEVEAASKVLPRPTPLQPFSSNDMLVEMPLKCNGTLVEVHDEVKDEDIDSPGTALSKLIEPLSLEKAVSDVVKHDECSIDFGMVGPTAPEGQCLVAYIEKKTPGLPDFGDENHLIEKGSSAHVSSNGSAPIDGGIHDLILASNKDSASRSSLVFNKLLPNDCTGIDIWGATSVSCKQDDTFIKEKFAMRKCSLRFKERVLTLKFRALQHLWKEDLRLLSARKYRAKSQKRFELNLRTSYAGNQKHRRSRFTSPGKMVFITGNLTLVPTAEVIDFTSKLLSDSQIKLYRNRLKMPPLILDEKERLSRFVTKNGLVEDPCAVENERVTINPWTPKEKEIFMEMLATFGKDFRKIASLLDHKTTADCIEFYYKNHKSESFEKIKEKLELKKQGRSFPTNTYMVTTGKKWNREVNSTSLDMLGAASVIAAHDDASVKTWQTCGGRSFLRRHYDSTISRSHDGIVERLSSFDILGNEREAAAADVLAGICGALSSEAVSSCVTSSIDPGEGCQEWKCQKLSSLTGRPLTPEVLQNFDGEETCSDDSCGELDSIDWTDEEKSIFIQALRSYGKDFAKISRCVRTRSRDQCKIFFSKARKCLGLDVIHPAVGNDGTPVSDANGGRSDTEDACVVEMDSTICSTLSCNKADVDFPSPVVNINREASRHAGANHMLTDREKNWNGRLDHEVVETGVKTVVPDDCQAEVKPVLMFDGGNNLVNGIDGKFGATPEVLQADATLSCHKPVQLHGTAVLLDDVETAKDPVTNQTVTSAEESISARGQVCLAQSRSNATVELKAVPGDSAEGLKIEPEGLKIEPEGHKLLVPQNGLDDEQDAKRGADTSIRSSGSYSFLPDSDIKGNVSHLAADASGHLGFRLTPNYQQMSLDLRPSIQKPQIISWKQQEICPVTVGSILRDSSVIQYEDHLRQAKSSSTLNFKVHGNTQHQKSVGTDVNHQYLLGLHSLNHVGSPQILRGYPVQILNQKEMNRDTDSIRRDKPIVVQNVSKLNRNSQSNQYFVQDLCREKCSGSKPPHSVTELPLLSKSQEQSLSDPRPHSRSSFEMEEHSSKTGDVKLFGQILSNPLPLPKSGPSIHENDDQGTSPKLNNRSFNLKFTGDHGTNGTLVPSKLDPSNYSGPEEFSMRSCGFWDGNGTQTGLSLSDSDILLAKYPAASVGFSTSLCGVELQPLPAVVKRNDRNLGVMSAIQARDVSGNRGLLPDYQVNGTKVQPYTPDVRQHEMFSEQQKRNGLETVSGFQQQGRGTVGTNVAARESTGVSDPVAAIKMHFAQAGSFREEESWRGKGDINR
ncbi:hypothetical protein HHK36_032406 [Tetracentron sinense]|uniref:SANT domain-containing protein n=1 Tax=Tetracentron sinense TaxID=13715 RepID=A0A834Y5K1_TETSI|nr:hypothetical protein HHK36_032406 [Tetracentron sinense]